ncbi:MAG TPA: LPXTG cell wall anchor domain-containing protein [Bryobacteraceae bacterium]|nr:LPXTG cell wall anchor domain-containing protein [Bryobacteraceae bacterium]
MTLKASAIGAIAILFFGIGPSAGRAQGPMYDRANVKLPYTVTLGDKTLPPGDYTFQELQASTKERVVMIYGDKGATYEAHVLTIPTLDNDTPDKTRLTLHHYGSDYYLYKLWISGKNYGYEFIEPANLKSRQQETNLAMTGTYTAPAAAAPAPEPAPAPAPAPEAAPAPPPPAPEPAPEAERAAPPAPEMPKTASGWTPMLLSGLTLLGVGLALTRYRRQNQA